MDIGWYMDGYLPWRLKVLEEAAEICLVRLKAAQMVVAMLPKKTEAREKASQTARDLQYTYLMIWEARFLLAPRA